MSCSTCHHAREREDEKLECHFYTPEIGEMKADGTNAQWPIVHPDDGCGQWLHKLYTGFLPVRQE